MTLCAVYILFATRIAVLAYCLFRGKQIIAVVLVGLVLVSDAVFNVS